MAVFALFLGCACWAAFVHSAGHPITTPTGAVLMMVPGGLWGWVVRDIEMLLRGRR